MQNTQETDLGTDVFRVGSNLEERLCTGLEEQLEEHLLVLPDERVERVRDAEYQVIVVDLCFRKHKFPISTLYLRCRTN